MATKVGRYEKDANRMFDFSAEKTKCCIENSLKTLGVDYLDIIQVNSQFNFTAFYMNLLSSKDYKCNDWLINKKYCVHYH